VVMYADRISDAMRTAIDETNHRRARQIAYNQEHGITPQTINKAVKDILVREVTETVTPSLEDLKKGFNLLVPAQRKALLATLEKEMLELAKNLEFERAALIRDEIERLKKGGA
ncbi:MAG: excinuclease ABC subunit B, partial [Spirochaetales bacterium]|nr:excinuclease ABC subunit B [Spirochaetales bacterium]